MIMANHLMPTYRQLPVSFNRGDGIYIWDNQQNRYLDALSGISVTSLGHSHPAITQAITEQAARLLHTSNLYHIENQQKLADLLCEVSGMEQAFFGNSGAEANEAAIKLARLYGHKNGIKKPEIVVMQGSFHGRTMATLSATGNRKVQAGFEPLVSGFVRAPYNDIEALRTIAKNNRNVVAILLEPVQGEGGINIPDAGYLTAIRSICDEYNWLMMLDEIQTGMARSGKMFAFQHEAITPDVVTLAKALGNGVPVGACLANAKAVNIFQPGNHGSTFGGNPFACRVAQTVVTIMRDQKLAENAQARGKQLTDYLRDQLKDNHDIVEIRNLGLLVGIELKHNCTEIVAMALQNRLLINVTADKVIRLLPPLIINEEQTLELADLLIQTINQFSNR
jgi:acetylornithine/N-succinyldiaminopimelate aminotransferase